MEVSNALKTFVMILRSLPPIQVVERRRETVACLPLRTGRQSGKDPSLELRNVRKMSETFGYSPSEIIADSRSHFNSHLIKSKQLGLHSL